MSGVCRSGSSPAGGSAQCHSRDKTSLQPIWLHLASRAEMTPMGISRILDRAKDVTGHHGSQVAPRNLDNLGVIYNIHWSLLACPLPSPKTQALSFSAGGPRKGNTS